MSTDNSFFFTTHSPRNPLIVNLVAIGEQVIHVDDFRILLDKNLEGCQGYIGNLFSEIKKLPAFIGLLRYLKNHHVPYIFWNRDAPWNVGIKLFSRCVLRWLQPVDIYLAHSQQTAHWFSQSYHCFPNAALKDYYITTDLNSLCRENNYIYDISFIGSFSNQKRQTSNERIDFLKTIEQSVRKKYSQLKVCFIDTTKQKLSIDKQINLIRTSKINLNYGSICDIPNKRSWGFPERVFGIPAAGGFLLTDYRKCISETFPNGICDFFKNIEECSQKIVCYLNNFKLLRDRAEQMHKFIIKNHTYEIRAIEFMRIVRNWHESATCQHRK